MEKRVLVPLPATAAREAMLKKLLKDRSVDSVDWKIISDRTSGYSGADIELVCREAAMMPVRRLMSRLEDIQTSPATSSMNTNGKPPLVQSNAIRTKNNIRDMNNNNNNDIEALLMHDKVTENDMLAALETTRPSSDGSVAKYEEWQNSFGSV